MQSPFVLSVLLFTRLDASAALAHPTRAEFLARVRERPGLTVSELARAALVDYKTAIHHVRTLARLGCVALVEDGRHKRVFVPGAPRAAPAFAPRALEVLHALRDGTTGPADLARRLGVPRGTAGSILDTMMRQGLAVRDAGGWRLSARAEAALGPALPLT